MTDIQLLPLERSDRERFIRDNQEACNYGALEEFGRRDDHFEEDGEIISRETIERSIDGGEAYRIMEDGRPVGGVVIRAQRRPRVMRGSMRVRSARRDWPSASSARPSAEKRRQGPGAGALAAPGAWAAPAPASPAVISEAARSGALSLVARVSAAGRSSGRSAQTAMMIFPCDSFSMASS